MRRGLASMGQSLSLAADGVYDSDEEEELAAALHLASYIPLQVLRMYVERPYKLRRPTTEYFPATVLFADISGFTRIADKLSKQENGVALLTDTINGLFDPVIAIVSEYGGDVVKFAGDALEIIFPVWTDDPQSAAAQRALAQTVVAATECGMNLNKFIRSATGDAPARKPSQSRVRPPSSQRGRRASTAVNKWTRLKVLWAINRNRQEQSVSSFDDNSMSLARNQGLTLYELYRKSKGNRRRTRKQASQRQFFAPTASAGVSDQASPAHRTSASASLASSKLKLKVSIAAGMVLGMHTGGVGGRWEYFIAGEPLAQIAETEACCKPGFVVMHAKAWELLHCEEYHHGIETATLPDTAHLRVTGITEPILTHRETWKMDGTQRANDVRGYIMRLRKERMSHLDTLCHKPTYSALFRGYMPRAVLDRIDSLQTQWIGQLRQLTILFILLPNVASGKAEEEEGVTPASYASRSPMSAVPPSFPSPAPLAATGSPFTRAASFQSRPRGTPRAVDMSALAGGSSRSKDSLGNSGPQPHPLNRAHTARNSSSLMSGNSAGGPSGGAAGSPAGAAATPRIGGVAMESLGAGSRAFLAAGHGFSASRMGTEVLPPEHLPGNVMKLLAKPNVNIAGIQASVFAAFEVLAKYEGTVRQFIVDDKGSVLIGAFGVAPFGHEDDEKRGVLAAVDIFNALTHDHGIECSIGVATGNVFCGNVGGKSRREYALVGDAVNLSARLMGYAYKSKMKAKKHAARQRSRVGSSGSASSIRSGEGLDSVVGASVATTIPYHLGPGSSAVSLVPDSMVSQAGFMPDDSESKQTAPVMPLPSSVPQRALHILSPMAESPTTPVPSTPAPVFNAPSNHTSTAGLLKPSLLISDLGTPGKATHTSAARLEISEEETAAMLRELMPSTTILVDERTYVAARRSIEFKELGEITVKGKPKPIQVFCPVPEEKQAVEPTPGDVQLVGREEQLEMWKAEVVALTLAVEEHSEHTETLGAVAIGALVNQQLAGSASTINSATTPVHSPSRTSRSATSSGSLHNTLSAPDLLTMLNMGNANTLNALNKAQSFVVRVKPDSADTEMMLGGVNNSAATLSADTSLGQPRSLSVTAGASAGQSTPQLLASMRQQHQELASVQQSKAVKRLMSMRVAGVLQLQQGASFHSSKGKEQGVAFAPDSLRGMSPHTSWVSVNSEHSAGNSVGNHSQDLDIGHVTRVPSVKDLFSANNTPQPSPARSGRYSAGPIAPATLPSPSAGAVAASGAGLGAGAGSLRLAATSRTSIKSSNPTAQPVVATSSKRPGHTGAHLFSGSVYSNVTKRASPSAANERKFKRKATANLNAMMASVASSFDWGQIEPGSTRVTPKSASARPQRPKFVISNTSAMPSPSRGGKRAAAEEGEGAGVAAAASALGPPGKVVFDFPTSVVEGKAGGTMGSADSRDGTALQTLGMRGASMAGHNQEWYSQRSKSAVPVGRMASLIAGSTVGGEVSAALLAGHGAAPVFTKSVGLTSQHLNAFNLGLGSSSGALTVETNAMSRHVVVLVTGLHGMGKSALVDAMIAEATAANLTVAVGCCEEMFTTSFHSWKQVFTQLLHMQPCLQGKQRATEVVDKVAAHLGLDSFTRSLLPLLNDLVPVNPPIPETALTENMAVGSRASNLRHLLVTIVTRMAMGDSSKGRRAQGIVIVLRDINHMDTTSSQLFVALSKVPNVLLLASTRSRDDLAEYREMGSLLDDPRTMCVDCRPLSAKQVKALICQTLDCSSCDHRITGPVHQRSLGAPLFVVQLCQLMVEMAMVRVEGGFCKLAPGFKSLDMSLLPDSIHGYVHSILDKLHIHDQIVLKVASVCGRTVSARMLTDVHPDNATSVDSGSVVPLEDIVAALHRLVKAKLLKVVKKEVLSADQHVAAATSARESDLRYNRANIFQTLLMYHGVKADRSRKRKRSNCNVMEEEEDDGDSKMETEMPDTGGRGSRDHGGQAAAGELYFQFPSFAVQEIVYSSMPYTQQQLSHSVIGAWFQQQMVRVELEALKQGKDITSTDPAVVYAANWAHDCNAATVAEDADSSRSVLGVSSAQARLVKALTPLGRRSTSFARAKSLVPVLAHHWARTPHAATAALYLEGAADLALARFAQDEALVLMRVLVGEADNPVFAKVELPVLKQAVWQRRIAISYLDSGSVRRAEDRCMRALELLHVRIPGPKMLRAKTLWQRLQHGMLMKACNCTCHCPGMTAKEGSNAALRLQEAAESMLILARTSFLLGNTRLHVFSLLAALRFALRRGPSASLSRVYSACAMSAHTLALSPPRALKYCHTALDIAVQLADTSLELKARTITSRFHTQRCDWEEAAKGLGEAAELAERVGNSREWEQVVNQLAVLTRTEGDVGEALNLYKLAAHSAFSRDDREMFAISTVGVASCYLAFNEPKLAQAELTEAMTAGTISASLDVLRVHALNATIMAYLGNRGEAVRIAIAAAQLVWHETMQPEQLVCAESLTQILDILLAMAGDWARTIRAQGIRHTTTPTPANTTPVFTTQAWGQANTARLSTTRTAIGGVQTANPEEFQALLEHIEHCMGALEHLAGVFRSVRPIVTLYSSRLQAVVAPDHADKVTRSLKQALQQAMAVKVMPLTNLIGIELQSPLYGTVAQLDMGVEATNPNPDASQPVQAAPAGMRTSGKPPSPMLHAVAEGTSEDVTSPAGTAEAGSGVARPPQQEHPGMVDMGMLSGEETKTEALGVKSLISSAPLAAIAASGSPHSTLTADTPSAMNSSEFSLGASRKASRRSLDTNKGNMTPMGLYGAGSGFLGTSDLVDTANSFVTPSKGFESGPNSVAAKSLRARMSLGENSSSWSVGATAKSKTPIAEAASSTA